MKKTSNLKNKKKLETPLSGEVRWDGWGGGILVEMGKEVWMGNNQRVAREGDKVWTVTRA
jgi:hypothetical protein